MDALYSLNGWSVFGLVLLSIFLYIFGFTWRLIRSDHPTDTALLPEESEQLADLQAKLAAHSLPVIRITPRAHKPAAIWASRFGGQPYWPTELTYPTTPDGVPLRLLAQLNLSDMPSLPGYPSKGILQFFVANDPSLGLRFPDSLNDRARYRQLNQEPVTFRVVYHDNIRTDINALRQDCPITGDDDDFPVSGEYALAFAREDEPMNVMDYRLDQTDIGSLFDLPDAVADVLYGDYMTSGSKVGGYAYFTQDDPRFDAEDDWLLLLQIDTSDEEGVDIMWGDSGVGNFFIRREALEQRDFGRVWYHWDCC